MKDGGRQHRAGMALLHAFHQVIERADAARGDDRHGYGIGNRARELQVEAGLGAVAVHGGEQDLAGAERHHFLGVGYCFEPRRLAPAVGEQLPSRRRARL